MGNYVKLKKDVVEGLNMMIVTFNSSPYGACESSETSETARNHLLQNILFISHNQKKHSKKHIIFCCLWLFSSYNLANLESNALEVVICG